MLGLWKNCFCCSSCPWRFCFSKHSDTIWCTNDGSNTQLRFWRECSTPRKLLWWLFGRQYQEAETCSLFRAPVNSWCQIRQRMYLKGHEHVLARWLVNFLYLLKYQQCCSRYSRRCLLWPWLLLVHPIKQFYYLSKKVWDLLFCSCGHSNRLNDSC